MPRSLSLVERRIANPVPSGIPGSNPGRGVRPRRTTAIRDGGGFPLRFIDESWRISYPKIILFKEHFYTC